MDSMLQFNPLKRKNAGELLKHIVFDKYRVKKAEVGASKKIYLNIDYDELTPDNEKPFEDITCVYKCKKDIIKLAHKYRKYI